MTQLTKNQLRALAGMPTVNEFEEEKRAKTSLIEGRSVEVHYSPAGPGTLGDVFIIDATEEVNALAKALGVPDNWKEPVAVGNLWASWLSGDRLAFFSNRHDYESDDVDSDNDEQN